MKLMIKLKFKNLQKSPNTFFNQLFIIVSFYNFFFIYMKISSDSSAEYYQENKERVQRKVCDRYQSLSKEDKEKLQQYICERYKNLSVDEKNWLAKYRKKYYKMRKDVLL